MSARTVIRVAVPVPLRREFDYRLPATWQVADCPPGVRVRVPFGPRKLIGVVTESPATSTLADTRLRPIIEVLDSTPVLPADMLDFLRWAAGYYHHPPGEVLQHALPALLRQGEAPQARGEARWQVTAAGREVDPATALPRAPRQAALLGELQAAGEDGLGTADFAHHATWREPLARLESAGWVTRSWRMPIHSGQGEPGPALNAEQQAAVDHVDGAGRFLLDGITGSGKTEVYLHLIQQAVDAGRQALVLVPEIGLTPQLLRRFRHRLAARITALHSGLTDAERLTAWLAAARGEADVIIGTRSAVFTPLARPGLFVVDEEHDTSLKQQDGFRYHARDLAAVRAQRAGVPVVLGSATPSLESLQQVAVGRATHLTLTERAGGARPPRFRVLDVRRQPFDGALSPVMHEMVAAHLAAGNQVLLFLNRRGFAPTLMCHDCGWIATCQRCDSHLTLHRGDNRLRCHHCGAERPLMTQCGECDNTELLSVGLGTERIETHLQEHYPDTEILRVDRDTTRRKGSLTEILEHVRQGGRQILIGTQMLAKGHHFPNVTLVGIVDADQGLYSADFRGPERMAQTILQVAGRAGRAEKPGEVVIQTHHPDNPLLMTLVREGYPRFAAVLMHERREAGWPPLSHLALLRAEAPGRGAPLNFLQQARELAAPLCPTGVHLLGPLPAPMEKRAGRYRAQLLVQCSERRPLHALLSQWLPQLEAVPWAREVRWSMDVDPQDMF